MAKRKAERRATRKRRRAHRENLQTPAGTLVADPQALAPTIHVCGYGPDGIDESTDISAAAIERSRKRWPVTWVHVIGLGDAKVIESLGNTFGLHRLALADAIHAHQRPKVEHWGEITQVVVRMADDVGSPDTEQLSIFIGSDFVLSFEERKGDLFEVLRGRLRADAAHVREGKSDFLAYELLDIVIDAFFPVLEHIGDELEAIEDEIPVAQKLDFTPRLRRVKQHLLHMRRAVWPLRDVLSALAAGDCPLIGDETRRYLRDCEDHCAQLIDIVTTHRELAADLVDLQISVAGQRLNEVIKVLTVMATVFIPLTFISSVYGMNFDPNVSPYNMPELHWRYGYPFALGLMLATVVGLIIYFRRRGWV